MQRQPPTAQFSHSGLPWMNKDGQNNRNMRQGQQDKDNRTTGQQDNRTTGQGQGQQDAVVRAKRTHLDLGAQVGQQVAADDGDEGQEAVKAAVLALAGPQLASHDTGTHQPAHADARVLEALEEVKAAFAALPDDGNGSHGVENCRNDTRNHVKPHPK